VVGALSILIMPFSVFGVKSRLEALETRLEEIQNEIRNLALRFPAGGLPAPDYDEVYPPRLHEAPPPERVFTRPPIPPARHELATAHAEDARTEPAMQDRPPPAPTARPARRNDAVSRATRSEPRLDWRR